MLAVKITVEVKKMDLQEGLLQTEHRTDAKAGDAGMEADPAIILQHCRAHRIYAERRSQVSVQPQIGRRKTEHAATRFASFHPAFDRPAMAQQVCRDIGAALLQR